MGTACQRCPNPYAPPTAAIADIEHLASRSTAPPFFAVSTSKLVIMCIATGTLYEVRLTAWNWVALPVGVFLWSLVLASYMIGER